ncbi:conserved Plasmodium protein, unknown function [Plasmodium sp. gorilla clade G2]|uniref:conserved Plasmodium protein, unknown function n=1 Tax=Plasmodium sp. gorilla clade G2 TaxID=880535 RepID=UPI000D215E85|nr:conserved Plasmodium protein, unknown function [Plasmodium sp. gorilla clade G2]SOV12608.1 conserved Plasmodium protein, unknown function [Plasmodium sp. gorilla clade G2]
MGNTISERKQRQFVLYKDIKNKIKKRNHLDIKNNLYISNLHEKKLLTYNDEIFELYEETYEEDEQKKEYMSDTENKKNYDIQINFKNDKKKNISLNKCDNQYDKHYYDHKYDKQYYEKDINEYNEDNKMNTNNVKEKKNDKLFFEFDYGSFYNVEERSSTFEKDQKKIKNYSNIYEENKITKKYELDKDSQDINKNINHFNYENEKKTEKKNSKSTMLKKKKNSKSDNLDINNIVQNKTVIYNDNEKVNNIINDKDYNKMDQLNMQKKNNDNNNNITHNSSTLKSVHLRNISDYTSKIKCNNNIQNEHKHYIYNEDTIKENKSVKKFFMLIKNNKNILQNILSFLNCSDLLNFQKTCSTTYICISDFLDYICLHIYSKFKNKYDNYFEPFNYFYKYEYLYTDNPSCRLDCILIAKINKECVGYNNRFGYKYKYLYDKKKTSYYVYFNFNVLKCYNPRTIEIYKDISYNNGDDINVSHIVNNDVCSNDYICIPINLFNFIGTVAFDSIRFIQNKLSKYITYNNQLDDQLWYNKEEYKILRKENKLITPEMFFPHLKHISTIYSGIDVTVMKSTYKAVEPGNLGKRSYSLWGNYFIIENKLDPVFIFLKREGLQHDYIYQNYYLRVGDSIIFYLIKGGNNI